MRFNPLFTIPPSKEPQLQMNAETVAMVNKAIEQADRLQELVDKARKYTREHIVELDTPETELKVKAYIADSLAQMTTYQVFQGDDGPTDGCKFLMCCIFYLNKRRTGKSSWEDENIGRLLAWYNEGTVSEDDVYNEGEAQYIDLIHHVLRLRIVNQ